MNLIFFTSSFPYSAATEDSFILPELDALCDGFDKVMIVPLSNSGSYKDISKHTKILVNESFAEQNKNLKKTTLSFIKNTIKALCTPLFIKAFLTDNLLFKPSKLRYSLQQVILSNRIKLWLNEYFNEKKDNTKYILYTYWFDYATTGCSYFANNKNIVKVITRAHGYDIFDFRTPERSSRMRGEVLSKLDAVYTASQAGALYLQKNYPKFTDKIHYCHLGINKKLSSVAQSDDNALNLFSCSYMISLKRVGLLASYIVELAKTYPDKKIVWTHAGGGELYDQVKNYVENVCIVNLRVILIGSVDNEKIIEHYIQKPVDIFLSLTESEGGAPVSMQEAQAFGVPIIATNVGGVREIVIDGKTGLLLTENPTQEEFIEKVGMLLKNKTLLLKMKKNSLKNWEENFDAEKNHKIFVSKIIRLNAEKFS